MPDPNDQTPLLSLPYIQGAQAQKHVTHNEALEQLDLLVQLVIETQNATTPPTSPLEGQAWIIGTGATGAWVSNTGDIAAWRGGGWLFVTPQTGWRAWDKTAGSVIAFNGTTWGAIGGSGGGGGGTPNLQNLPGVGINATSDTTNRLSVTSPATLLNHQGGGHQLKINKAGSGDTASLLYQSNWSGRAEMGLAGNDDFSIKVSADGGSFTQALHIDGASGAVTLPATGTRQWLPYSYRYYFYTDKRWVAPTSNTGTKNANQNLGTNADPNIDWDGKGVYVPAGTQIHSFDLAGNPTSNELVDLDLRLFFQHGPWNASWDSNTTTTRIELYNANSAGLLGAGGMRRTRLPLSFTAPADGYFTLAARPDAASTLISTRYFYMEGALDVTLPPSA